MNKTGCLLCNAELRYQEKSELMTCDMCGIKNQTNTKCTNEHFICDSCHEIEGIEYIEMVCRKSTLTNPIALADEIMHNPKINMHGPEHHFLVPAVLLTCFYNKTGNTDELDKKLTIARERAENVLGGFCGLYGACGAAIGTGIFISTVLKATPLSEEDWKLCNLITSESLHDIAHNGGPRCCKRDTYLAIEAAMKFVSKHFSVTLDQHNIICNFNKQNMQCTKNKCLYYPANSLISLVDSSSA